MDKKNKAKLSEEDAKKIAVIVGLLWGAGATGKDAKSMALILWQNGFHIVRR